MKKKLLPMCSKFKDDLLKRAEKQMTEALRIYTECERLHAYTARHSAGGQDFHDDCISAYGVVVRWDKDNECLVYHDSMENWWPVTNYRSSLVSLCECADELLTRAYEYQLQNRTNR